MSGKIITLWGGAGCGKTTFAVNLACALAGGKHSVGLISSNLVHGDLQTFFAQSIPLEKGLYQALSRDQPGVSEKFMTCEENRCLCYLAVPTHYTGLLCDTVTLQSVEELITESALAFDFVIIDGSRELTNPVSSTGLWMAEKILTLHKPSIRAQMWFQGVSDFVKELHIGEKQVHLLRNPNGSFDTGSYRSITGCEFIYELPHVKRAEELENAGKPLYYFPDRKCRQYKKVLEKIAGQLCGGGQHV